MHRHNWNRGYYSDEDDDPDGYDDFEEGDFPHGGLHPGHGHGHRHGRKRPGRANEDTFIDYEREEFGWSPQCKPNQNPLPPAGQHVDEPIQLLDKNDFPIYTFHLCFGNKSDAVRKRMRKVCSLAQERRQQKGGELMAVFEAATHGENPKLKRLHQWDSEIGEIYVTDVDRHDLYEVVKAISTFNALEQEQSKRSRSENGIFCWRLLGVGTGISENQLFLIKLGPQYNFTERDMKSQTDAYRNKRWVPVDIDDIEGVKQGMRNVSNGRQPTTPASRFASNRERPMAGLTSRQRKDYEDMITAQRKAAKKKR